MKIVSHRGYWEEVAEQNKVVAFERAICGGFGIELDLRDHNGQVVVAHDPPVGAQLLFSEFLKINNICDVVLALNIKSDGLSDSIFQMLKAAGVVRYFAFDMSMPESRRYLSAGLKTFFSISEFIKGLPSSLKYDGVWLDSFNSEWFSVQLIRDWLDSGIQICIVSPELHGRPHLPLWATILDSGLHLNENLLICTDFPKVAEQFFKGRKDA